MIVLSFKGAWNYSAMPEKHDLGMRFYFLFKFIVLLLVPVHGLSLNINIYL